MSTWKLAQDGSRRNDEAAKDLACVSIKFTLLLPIPSSEKIPPPLAHAMERGKARCSARSHSVSAPKRPGFGTTVIEAMAKHSLDGAVDLDFAPSGVTWQLVCPVAKALERSTLILPPQV